MTNCSFTFLNSVLPPLHICEPEGCIILLTWYSTVRDKEVDRWERETENIKKIQLSIFLFLRSNGNSLNFILNSSF